MNIRINYITSQMKSPFFSLSHNSYFMCAEGSWFMKYTHTGLACSIEDRATKNSGDFFLSVSVSRPILRSSTAWTIPFLVSSTSLKPKLFVCKLVLTPKQTNACQACPVQIFECVQNGAYGGVKSDIAYTCENFSKRILHLLMMAMPG